MIQSAIIDASTTLSQTIIQYVVCDIMICLVNVVWYNWNFELTVPCVGKQCFGIFKTISIE